MTLLHRTMARGSTSSRIVGLLTRYQRPPRMAIHSGIQVPNTHLVIKISDPRKCCTLMAQPTWPNRLQCCLRAERASTSEMSVESSTRHSRINRANTLVVLRLMAQHDGSQPLALTVVARSGVSVRCLSNLATKDTRSCARYAGVVSAYRTRSVADWPDGGCHHFDCAAGWILSIA